MTRRRTIAIAATILLAAAVAVAALGAIGWPARAYRNGDFTQYWLQPRALLDGGDPYDPRYWSAAHAAIGQLPESAQAVYPPHDAIAFLPLALLPLPYAAAAWIVAQLLLVSAALAILAWRLVPPARRAVFLAIGVSFQPVWLLAVGANVTGFLFAALAAAYLAARGHRLFRAGALLGLLVVKPHPFAIVAIALLIRCTWPERRRLALGALSTSGPLVAAALVLRPTWYAEWLRSALTLGASSRSNATAWTLGRVAGLPEWSGPLVAAIAIGGFGLWLVRARPSLARTMSGAIPISLAVAPYGWSYDQLQLLIPLAAIVAAAARPARLALVAIIATALPWALYALAFQRGGEELSVITPLLVSAIFIGRSDLLRPRCRGERHEPLVDAQAAAVQDVADDHPDRREPVADRSAHADR